MNNVGFIGRIKCAFNVYCNLRVLKQVNSIYILAYPIINLLCQGLIWVNPLKFENLSFLDSLKEKKWLNILFIKFL